MAKQRIEYIDTMRGFTMILVVFAHVCHFCLGDSRMGYNAVFILFRLPCFFMISGWLFESVAQRDGRNRLSLSPHDKPQRCRDSCAGLFGVDSAYGADRCVGSCFPKITICTLASPFAHNENEYSYETASNWYRRNGFGHLVQG